MSEEHTFQTTEQDFLLPFGFLRKMPRSSSAMHNTPTYIVDLMISSMNVKAGCIKETYF